MKVLIKSAKIHNSPSTFHLQTKDILLENGVIIAIEDDITDEQATKLEGEDMRVSAGWFDLYSVVREPGQEHKDRVTTLLDSAAFGGFTDVLGVSGCTPPLYSKAQIELVKNLAMGHVANVHPLGTITEKKEGKNITELYDLHQAGALAFSDGKKHLKNPELLKRALLYVKPFGGKIMVYGEDCDLANNGMVNEGEVAATLGMKVRPAISEEVALERNLKLAQYTDTPIHIHAISSKNAVEIIENAKKQGIQVTCDVNLANLCFNDRAVEDFDCNYKVLPVLRTEEDRVALIEGVKSGVIDAVASGHTPQDIESKACEFDHAEFGMTTLEAAGAALFALPELSEEIVLELLSERARKVMNLPVPVIKVGEKAILTICAKEAWELEKNQITSISKNNPFIGMEFQHKIIGVVNNGQHQFN